MRDFKDARACGSDPPAERPDALPLPGRPDLRSAPRADRFAAPLALAAALASPACGEPAAGCVGRNGCPEGQVCVYTSAAASSGVCVEPQSSLGIPGQGGGLWLVRDDQLDVLFVVDNSPALADRQAQLAAAAGTFAEALLARRPEASLRIAVTTTDAGNPLCPAAPDPGGLRAKSCRARLDEFTATVDGTDLDVRGACTDACATADLALRPTATDFDPTPRVRPWLEVAADGGGNLPDGLGLADALRCAVPQGIAGCAFTSPLASLRLALDRATQEGDPGHDFLRDGADLLIIVVSASEECSATAAGASIFTDDPVFWGDLMPPDLTPAVCWRAGVQCQGSGPAYDDCGAVDLGLDGQPTTPDMAALESTESLSGLLSDLLHQRQMLDISTQMALVTVGGVPPGYPDQPIAFEDADDPAFQKQHGIGPGCAAAGSSAPPPPRLLAVGEALAEEVLGPSAAPLAASICPDDWTDAITGVAEEAAAWLYPVCFPNCAADMDPATPALDPECEVITTDLMDFSKITVPPCTEEGGAAVPPPGSTRCFILRFGDELDPLCKDEGYNLEIELHAVVPDSPTVEYRGSCALSLNKHKDCPFL